MSEEHPVIGDVDPLIGTVLAERYRIEKKLGEGGMGAVYLARHVILEKIVALKVLHDEYARRRELVERFLHEAKAASRIRHEHVIDITDFGETATKNVFFAMEFLDGRDLASELTRPGHIAWPRVKSMILQLCAALQAAHEAGVIHRDLKPENIYLIERLGNPDFVKVLDFGVAKLTEIDEGRRLTRTGMVFGTPEYMSPEQARGEKPDARVDVYATGCILFEMVTGDVPFRADNFMGVLTKHLFDALPLVAERTNRTDLPSGLQDVISQALAKDKNQRFSSMNELAVALDTLDQTDGIVYHAPTGERSRRHQLPPPVVPDRGAVSRAKTTPLDVDENDRTMPRVAAIPRAFGAGDSELALPRRRSPRALMVAGGVLVALGVAAFVYVKSNVLRAPVPDPVRPETPTTVSAPATATAPSPNPNPNPNPNPTPAPTPEPAAATAPPPAPAAAPEPVPVPAPAPDPVPAPAPAPAAVVVEPPPKPQPTPTRRPSSSSSRDRDRSRRRPAPAAVRPSPPPSAPIASPPPTPTPSPNEVVVPKSDLKDPFRKK